MINHDDKIDFIVPIQYRVRVNCLRSNKNAHSRGLKILRRGQLREHDFLTRKI